MDSLDRLSPDSEQQTADSTTRRGLGGIAWTAIGTIFFGSLLAIGILPRFNQRLELQASVKEASTVPTVTTIVPRRATAKSELELPGSVVALNQTTIYSRSTGYLRRWYADIGDRVRAGQLLAEIDSPDIDQQVLQAKAELVKAEASVVQARASLAKSNSDVKQAQASLAKSISDLKQVRATLARSTSDVKQAQASLAKSTSDVKQTQANLALADRSSKRWELLVKKGAVSQQDADTKSATYQANLANVEAVKNTVNVSAANVESAKNTVNVNAANVESAQSTVNANAANVESAQNTVNANAANVKAAEANVYASRANLQRNLELQSYKRITAPFAGVITARNVNTGVLISSGSGNTTSTNANNTSLYTIAADEKLNVNVNLPQSRSRSLKLGQTAQITVKELRQRVFTGRVVRNSNTIDPNTRTLLTQLEVDNADATLRPGMYATVKFAMNRTEPPFVVPDSALVVNAGGTQVATLTKDKTVHYQKVVVGRDFGTEVEITSGLTGNESLIATPTIDLTEGSRVQVEQKKQKKAASVNH